MYTKKSHTITFDGKVKETKKEEHTLFFDLIFT